MVPEIAEGIGAVVLEMRNDFPQAKILLLGILYRRCPAIRCAKIAESNWIIAKMHDQRDVFYLDIGASFLADRGTFSADVLGHDNLRPQTKGYGVWAVAVKDRSPN